MCVRGAEINVHMHVLRRANVPKPRVYIHAMEAKETIGTALTRDDPALQSVSIRCRP